jgi:hypothetical protein
VEVGGGELAIGPKPLVDWFLCRLHKDARVPLGFCAGYTKMPGFRWVFVPATQRCQGSVGYAMSAMR